MSRRNAYSDMAGKFNKKLERVINREDGRIIFTMGVFASAHVDMPVLDEAQFTAAAGDFDWRTRTIASEAIASAKSATDFPDMIKGLQFALAVGLASQDYKVANRDIVAPIADMSGSDVTREQADLMIDRYTGVAHMLERFNLGHDFESDRAWQLFGALTINAAINLPG